MCYVDIDEQGTEAAAVTYMEYRCCSGSMPEPGTPFYVLSPYIYFIFQRATGIILFVGAVNNPRADE